MSILKLGISNAFADNVLARLSKAKILGGLREGSAGLHQLGRRMQIFDTMPVRGARAFSQMRKAPGSRLTQKTWSDASKSIEILLKEM